MSAGSELVTFDEKQGLSPNEVLVHTHDWVFRSALPDVQYRALVHCQFADSSHGWLIIIIEHGGFYVVQIRQTQHDAAIVRFDHEALNDYGLDANAAVGFLGLLPLRTQSQ